MSVSMALFDFLPVLAFLVTAIILQHDLYHMMSKGDFALFSCGTILVVISGVYKATWKLLYALNICDFQQLNFCFMPMMGTGFLITGISLIALLVAKQESSTEKLNCLVAPAVFSGTMIFVAFDVVGLLAMGIVMSIISAKMKKKKAIVFFVLGSIGLLAMGYLSSKDFTQAIFNWIAEFVNLFAQLSLLGGTLILHKAGLEKFKLK